MSDRPARTSSQPSIAFSEVAIFYFRKVVVLNKLLLVLNDMVLAIIVSSDIHHQMNNTVKLFSERCTLYMATLVAIRFNTKIKNHYMHLKAKGKESKVAIVACMRKFITILNYLIKSDQLWNAN